VTNLHVEVFGSGEPAVLVHGSFGWGLDTFPRQVELADSYAIHVVDRAVYGDSPAIGRIGWETDMQDIAAILDDLGPAHVVGQSYGAVVALLAAGLRPECVRSLVVIEPPLFGVASHDQTTASLAQSLRLLADQAETMDTAGYVAAWAAIVMNWDQEKVRSWSAAWSDRDWAAAESSRLERSPVDAPVAFDVLSALAVPKVLAVGGWPEDLTAARHVGRAFRVVAETIAARIGADVVTFDRSTHNPQLQQPESFNELLRRVWAQPSDKRLAPDHAPA
jgi:pimeloyl-ACP methyl ester carboxylesterase